MDGVHDAAPGEAAKWRFVRRRVVALLLAHGYREVQPSTLEPAGTGARAGARALALPDGSELTADPQASLARVFAAAPDGPFARWMSAGVAFDDAPAAPFRWRAWHAVSALLVGASEPAADAELAEVCAAVADDLALPRAQVVVSTVGEPGDLERYLAATAELRQLECAACREREAVAPLAFLSCDDEGCRALAASAPPFRDFVSVPAQRHHESVLATLEASGVAVHDEPRLAFGAGRFQRTLVELRAQTPDGRTLAVARGGRRDRLLQAFAGTPSPALGLTVGVARAAACTPGEHDGWETPCEVFIAARGAAARAWALKVAAAERARGFRVEIDLREAGWAEQLKRADEVRARVVVVVGDVERKRGEVAIRDMTTRETRHVPEESLPSELKKLLR